MSNNEDFHIDVNFEINVAVGNLSWKILSKHLPITSMPSSPILRKNRRKVLSTWTTIWKQKSNEGLLRQQLLKSKSEVTDCYVNCYSKTKIKWRITTSTTTLKEKTDTDDELLRQWLLDNENWIMY